MCLKNLSELTFFCQVLHFFTNLDKIIRNYFPKQKDEMVLIKHTDI